MHYDKCNSCGSSLGPSLVEHTFPRGNLVLLRALPDSEFAEETEGGIIIPRTDSLDKRQRHNRWLVVAAGPDVGEPALQIPGMEVLLKGWRGVIIDLGDGESYTMVLENDCIATVSPQ
jgi:co-chaperonin GroES (HSP10)